MDISLVRMDQLSPFYSFCSQMTHNRRSITVPHVSVWHFSVNQMYQIDLLENDLIDFGAIFFFRFDVRKKFDNYYIFFRKILKFRIIKLKYI